MRVTICHECVRLVGDAYNVVETNGEPDKKCGICGREYPLMDVYEIKKKEKWNG